MEAYHGRKPVFKGNEEKMNLRPRNNNMDAFDILIKDVSTKPNNKDEEIIYDENFILSIPELSKNIKPRKVSTRNILKVNIPIPHFEILNFQSIPNETEDMVEDISDLAYCNRHRKYELAEKRVKNRENEVLQYNLYKMQELEEKMRYMEINNLIPLQNEIINNTLDSTSSNGSNISNKKIIDNDYIKGNKEVLKKNKKHSKCEKSKSHVKKPSKENSVHQRKQQIDVNEEKTKKNINEKLPENINNNHEIKKEKDNDLQIIGIVNVVESEYEKLLKNKSRLNAAIEKLLSCRINPYPDETHKLRRCSRKLKAFGVPLPHSLNKQIIFDNVILKQKYLNLNLSKHRMSKRFRTTRQQFERKNLINI